MSIRSVGTDGARFDSGEGESSLAVLNVQHALNELAGSKIVPEDGLFGIETSNAVLNFQREHQIPATGQIDEKTIDSIHIALQKQSDIATGSSRQTIRHEQTRKEDLTLTGILIQSKIADTSGVVAPQIHAIADSFGTSMKKTLDQLTTNELSQTIVQASLQTLLHQPSQNAVMALGSAIGNILFDSALPSLLKYPPMRMPITQLSSQLEAVLLRSSALSAPQFMAIAENTAALVRSTIPVITEIQPAVIADIQKVLRQIHFAYPSFVPESGLIKLPGTGVLREAGDTIATLLTGAACRHAPLSNILQSPAFMGAVSTFALSAAVPAIGSSAGSASTLHAAAFTSSLVAGFTNHLPELLSNAGMDDTRIKDFVEELPGQWFLLSLTITTVTMAVMIAITKSSVEFDHREIVQNLRTAVQMSVDMEMASSLEAMATVMKQTAATCEQTMAAVAYATEAARLKSAVQSGLLPSVDPKVAASLQGIVQRILSTMGKITEHSRRILLLTEGI